MSEPRHPDATATTAPSAPVHPHPVETTPRAQPTTALPTPALPTPTPVTASADDDEDGAPRKRALSNLDVLRFLWGIWMARPGLLAGSAGFVLLSVAADLAVPLAAGALASAVSRAPDAASSAAAQQALIAFLMLSAAVFICRNVGARFWNHLASGNMADLVQRGFARVQTFSSDWHANTFAGSTVRKITRGMWAYDTLSDVFLWGLGPSVLVLVGMTVLIALQWPLAGLWVGLMIAAFVAANLALSRFYIRPANRISQRLDSRMTGALADAIGNNPAVKSFGAEAREQVRFGSVAQRWRRMALLTWNRFSNAWSVQIALLIALQIGFMTVIIDLWRSGQADAGAVTFAVSSFLIMSGHLRQFGEHVQQLQRGIDELEDLVVFERTAPQVADPAQPVRAARADGEIVFDRVDFGYPGQQGRLLYQGFSIRIAPGERVALVGATGSGKSTFVKLLQRLHDVDGGSIRIDGTDVRAVPQALLRAGIAVVPQDPALFHRSIADNIAYARPGVSRAAIEDAARRARAHDFIARLPRGYATLVGERGVKLSGGERQRVALARAFVADAPILVLDEATSSLDNETEAEVQAAMRELMAGRTTIVIAHRLSTIRDADRILVFDQGRIVEQGRHADLVARGGTYARLEALSRGDLIAAE
jgi:ATP-binding cassette subfamily B protein